MQFNILLTSYVWQVFKRLVRFLTYCKTEQMSSMNAVSQSISLPCFYCRKKLLHLALFCFKSSPPSATITFCQCFIHPFKLFTIALQRFTKRWANRTSWCLRNRVTVGKVSRSSILRKPVVQEKLLKPIKLDFHSGYSGAQSSMSSIAK